MLPGSRLKQLQELVNSSTKEELIWINGYLSGIVSNGHTNGNGTSHSDIIEKTDLAKQAVKKISLVFGTDTGNSKKLATDFAAFAKKQGIIAKLQGLDQYRLTDLTREEYFFVIISTHGEGEPPAAAKKFYDHIHQDQLSLGNLKFGVLALGDTAYPLFCKTGEDVDLQLNKLGAQRIIPLQKCDLDFEADAEDWFGKVIQALNTIGENKPDQSTYLPVTTKKVKTGKKYYNGTILTNINLNDKGSNKQTYHIEIGVDEPVEYEPGDAIAIVPNNQKGIADKIIELSGIDPALVIEAGKTTANVEELLGRHLNICYLLTSTVRKYAAITQQDIPDTRIDLVDLLRIYPVRNAGQFSEIIKTLSPIAPRLYSIASAPSVHENEIHITVSKKLFYAQDEQRFGLCSEFLGDLPVNTKLTFYVHRNRAFKLAPPEKDMILVGPGTGIAPMRSFLAERNATGADGRNWLFFGEQHFTTDFLYQTEIQQFVHTGLLTHVHLAFSRDQDHKIYVQHRMLQHGLELYNWLQNGAHFYVSGCKDPMSIDVETTLLKIIEVHGGKSAEEAMDYLDQLKKENRYGKDVY